MKTWLIMEVYKKFKDTDGPTLRKQIVELVENESPESILIDPDHLEAVKLLNKNDPFDKTLLFLRCMQMYSYFLSSEFKEKLNEDVLSTLREKKELLKISREKISQISVDAKNLQAKMEKIPQLFESLSINALSELVNMDQLGQYGHTNENISEILSKIDRKIRTVSKHIKVASDFFQVLSQPKLKKLMRL